VRGAGLIPAPFLSLRPNEYMSVRLTQSAVSGDYVGAGPYTLPPGPPAWDGAPLRPESEGVPWGRYIDAFKRHALLILLIVMAGSAAGLYAARRVKPVYEVQATLWITPGLSAQSGPIRAQQLLPQTSWVDLLRSFAIIDPVVRRLRLNVSYRQPGDSIFFRDFESGPLLRPGQYLLKIEPNRRYEGDPDRKGSVRRFDRPRARVRLGALRRPPCAPPQFGLLGYDAEERVGVSPF